LFDTHHHFAYSNSRLAYEETAMFAPLFEMAQGTRVEEVTKHPENPVDEVEHQPLFHNGYWQVVVASDGSNPGFPQISWALLLIAPIDKTLDFNLKNEGYTTVLVDPDTEIEKITTRVEVFHYEEIDWEYPVIVLDIYSKHSGKDKLLFLCNQPEPIEKPVRARMN
jgi:hypothetical protein